MSFSVGENLPPVDVQTLLLADWVLPVTAPPIPHGFVAIANGVITGVGRQSELGTDLPKAVRTQILTPGLVNAHLHLEQSLGRMIPKLPEQPMAQWLMAVKQTMTGESVRAFIEAGLDEAVATGTTCFGDICQSELPFEILHARGLRGLISLEFFHPNAEHLNYDRLEAVLASYQALKDRYSTIDVGLSPHSPFNVSPDVWRFLLAQTDARFHTHLSESEDEVAYLRGQASGIPALHEAFLNRTFKPDGYAETPVRYLAQHGLLNERTVIAHGIECSESDIAVLADSGVGLVHCPTSNLNLHGKTIRAGEWELPVALGTDGHLSTGHLDVRAEARLAMELHGWDAKMALRHLTVEGARVLGMADRIGSLAVGKAADMVCWIDSSFGSYPSPNPLPQGEGAIVAPEDWMMGSTAAVQCAFVAGREVYGG